MTLTIEVTDHQWLSPKLNDQVPFYFNVRDIAKAEEWSRESLTWTAFHAAKKKDRDKILKKGL